MSLPITKKVFLLLMLVLFIAAPSRVISQSKRIKPPKRLSKIKSADQFIKNAFKLYDKIYVYDSLTIVGVDIPSELEDELTLRAEQDLDSLWQLAPDIIDDIGDASFMKQARATMNLNKAKKALKYCGLTIKNYFLGEEEEEEEDEEN